MLRDVCAHRENSSPGEHSPGLSRCARSWVPHALGCLTGTEPPALERFSPPQLHQLGCRGAD